MIYSRGTHVQPAYRRYLVINANRRGDKHLKNHLSVKIFI